MKSIDNHPEAKIAVVIVNYNGGSHIITCLSELAKQSYVPGNIIVVDNNSSDGSNTNIKRQFPEVNLIQLEQNTGFSAANNSAFATLKNCSWVALLNPDTIPSTDWLKNIVDAIQSDPDCDIFASRLMDANDHRRIDGSGDVYHVSGLGWRRHHGMLPSEISVNLDPIFSSCAAAAVYRLESVLAVGGFDESFFCYYEDIDLVFRMRLNGSEIKYVETSIVSHVGSGLTGKDSDFSVYHGHRNMVWTYVKNMPGWYAIWYLPQHVLLNLVSLAYYTFRGRPAVIWKSKWDAVKGLKSALIKRKEIQQNRCASDAEIIRHMTKGFFRPYLSRFK